VTRTKNHEALIGMTAPQTADVFVAAADELLARADETA
jgi:hypothetical protein